MDTKTATIDGIPMRWLEQGSGGTPVVLVHGIPTSPALWRKVTPLAGQSRMLAWEMVGYGESIPAGEDRDISIARQASYLRAWMRHLELERAVLVGHDLGGGVAQIAAIEEPSLCGGLVLTNCIGYDSWPIPSVRAMRSVGALLSRLPAGVMRGVLAMLFVRGHDDVRIARECVDVHYQPYRKHGGTKALVRQMRALDTRDTLAVQDQIPTLRELPARVVWGAADPFQKLRYGEKLARDLSCPIDRIEGGKHFVPEDHPDRIARAIAQVLDEMEHEHAAPRAHA